MERPRRMRTPTPQIQHAARELRRDSTPAESVLWEALRRHQLERLRFRRQHAVDRFVLDFYCPACKLAVEVDGEIHLRQQEQDAERTAALASRGIRVIRFRNDEVMTDLPSVLARIVAAAREGGQT